MTIEDINKHMKMMVQKRHESDSCEFGVQMVERIDVMDEEGKKFLIGLYSTVTPYRGDFEQTLKPLTIIRDEHTAPNPHLDLIKETFV